MPPATTCTPGRHGEHGRMTGQWSVASGHCRTMASSDGPAVLLTAALLTASPADVDDDDDGVSSMYLSTERRRAFMKKLTTVDTLRPSCSAIVAWISLLGRLISLKMATSVRRWISVKTMRGFFTALAAAVAMVGQDDAG